MATAHETDRMHPSQVLALTFGAIYTLVGIVGFFITGFENFAGNTDKHLLWFEINPLHNLAHLLFGILGLMMYKTLRSARTYGWMLAVTFGILFLYGLMAAGNDEPNFLSINSADNWLHLLTAGVGLAAALWPATRTTTTSMGTRTGTAH